MSYIVCSTVCAVLIRILNRSEIKTISQKYGLDMDQGSVSRLLTTIWKVKLAKRDKVLKRNYEVQIRQILKK